MNFDVKEPEQKEILIKEEVKEDTLSNLVINSETKENLNNSKNENLNVNNNEINQVDLTNEYDNVNESISEISDNISFEDNKEEINKEEINKEENIVSKPLDVDLSQNSEVNKQENKDENKINENEISLQEVDKNFQNQANICINSEDSLVQAEVVEELKDLDDCVLNNDKVLDNNVNFEDSEIDDDLESLNNNEFIGVDSDLSALLIKLGILLVLEQDSFEEYKVIQITDGISLKKKKDNIYIRISIQ